MKKVMKLAALVMAVCLMVSMFSACTEKPADDGSDVIIMGTNAEFPPFEYVTETGGIVDNFSGIDVAIANEIAKGMNKTLKVENMEFDSLIMALATGKVDFVAAGMSVTEDRKKSVDFSDTYYIAKQVMIVQEDADIKSAADLDGKKIGVVNGYTGDVIVTEDLGYEPERFKKGADAVMDLVNGKLDVVVMDSAPADAFVKKNEGLKVVEDTTTFENEEYAIAVPKGNEELLTKINEILAKLKAEGKIDEFGATYSE